MFAGAKRKQQKPNKSRFVSYSARNSVLIISHFTFRDCRVHILSDNLSRNSCILKFDHFLLRMPAMNATQSKLKCSKTKPFLRCFLGSNICSEHLNHILLVPKLLGIIACYNYYRLFSTFLDR